jgi:hypothetical protein
MPYFVHFQIFGPFFCQLAGWNTSLDSFPSGTAQESPQPAENIPEGFMFSIKQ